MSRSSVDSSVYNLKATSAGPPPAGSGTANAGGGFWNSLGRALSNDRGSGEERNDRSNSRGRDIASSGRGGAGNFVRSESQSKTRVNRVADGDERGRDVVPRDDTRVTHAGRGGQGNVRSPSRDPIKDAADRAYEDEVLRKSRENREQYGLSSGRGGVGNIDRSRSRSREPGFGAGRGGLGNILGHDHHQHTGAELGKLDEEERAAAEAKHGHGILSHGRGGAGNLSSEQARGPTGTAPVDAGTHIGGRGGPGNVYA